MDQFKRFYRSLDALLVDDIRFFAEKKKLKKNSSIFSITVWKPWNYVASDRYLKKLKNWRTFKSPTTAIKAADLETRVAILLEEHNHRRREVAFFIAPTLAYQHSRERGWIKSLIKQYKTSKGGDDIDFVRDTLKKEYFGSQRRLVTVKIFKSGVNIIELKASDSNQKIAFSDSPAKLPWH